MNKKDFEEEGLNKWLEQMRSEEISVPVDRLEEGTKRIIGQQKRKERHRGLKVATILVGISIGSYVLSPNVQALAHNIIEQLLGDAGLNMALEEGYPHIADQEITIGAYRAKIHHIYIDEQRFNMNFSFYDLPEEENVAYELHLKEGKEAFDYEVGISYSSFFGGKEDTSINMVGAGVKKILEQPEIQVPLVLEKHDYNHQKNEVLGEAEVTLTIPDELRQESKVERVEQTLQLNGGLIKLKQIEMAPTMMTLSFESQVEDKIITGLKELCVENDKGEIFDQTMSISGGYDEQGGFEEFIVPSLYFSTYHSIKVKASGYFYEYKKPESFTLKIDEKLPKMISYRGELLRITELNYDEEQELLSIGISRENMTNHMDQMIIDGKKVTTVSMHGKYDQAGNSAIKEYIYLVHLPKKESYDIALNIRFFEEALICWEF